MSFSRLKLAIIPIIAHILPRTTDASCSTFRAASPIYTYQAQNQMQNVSQGLYCSPSYNNDSSTPGGYGGCASYIAGTNQTYTGCKAYGSGVLTATGFTNLSNLSDNDLAGIYTLVGNSGIPSVITVAATWTTVVGYGFSQSFNGCIPVDGFDVYEPNRCMRVGDAGYISMEPLLKCINGTLEDCSNGPVASGTGISICGVGTDSWNDMGRVPRQNVSWASSQFVNLTQQQAMSMTVNPANTSTCAAVYKQEQNFGITLRWVNEPLLYAAVMLVAWLTS